MVHAHLATQYNKFHHKSIELSTYGINYLGTPHQGTDTTDLATLLLGIRSIYSETNDAVVQDIRLHSAALQQQLSQYSSISQNYKTKFFFETYDTWQIGGFKKRVCHSLHSGASALTRDIFRSFQNFLRLSQGQSMRSRFLCTRTTWACQSLGAIVMGTSGLLLHTCLVWSRLLRRRSGSDGIHTNDMRVCS